MPKHNVIAIDDFSMNLLVLKNTLSDLVNIYTIKSASSAILTLNKIPKVDLILLDLEMPDMSGFEFLEFLRASDIYNSIPVIIISSNSKVDTITKAVQYSITDFIAKPFNTEILREKVSKVLGLPYKKSIDDDPFGI